VAISICDKRLLVNDEDIFKVKEWSPEFESISDDIHAAMTDLKGVANFGT